MIYDRLGNQLTLFSLALFVNSGELFIVNRLEISSLNTYGFVVIDSPYVNGVGFSDVLFAGHDESMRWMGIEVLR